MNVNVVEQTSSFAAQNRAEVAGTLARFAQERSQARALWQKQVQESRSTLQNYATLRRQESHDSLRRLSRDRKANGDMLRRDLSQCKSDVIADNRARVSMTRQMMADLHKERMDGTEFIQKSLLDFRRNLNRSVDASISEYADWRKRERERMMADLGSSRSARIAYHRDAASMTRQMIAGMQKERRDQTELIQRSLLTFQKQLQESVGQSLREYAVYRRTSGERIMAELQKERRDETELLKRSLLEFRKQLKESVERSLREYADERSASRERIMAELSSSRASRREELARFHASTMAELREYEDQRIHLSRSIRADIQQMRQNLVAGRRALLVETGEMMRGFHQDRMTIGDTVTPPPLEVEFSQVEEVVQEPQGILQEDQGPSYVPGDEAEVAGIQEDDIESLKERIIEVITKSPDGITLTSIGSKLDVEWRKLIRPTRDLLSEGLIRKEDVEYYPKQEENPGSSESPSGAPDQPGD